MQRALAKSKSRNSDIDWHLKSVDELLDCVVAKILRGRPRASRAIVRPKFNNRGIPVEMRIENGQSFASVSYILPSWRKKLKHKMTDNIRKSEKLDPVMGNNCYPHLQRGVSVHLFAHRFFHW
jgi:hypothetical protein